MSKHTNSIYTQIRKKIIANGKGKIYFHSDFPDIEAESVRKSFTRLVNDKFVIRLAPGIFLFPIITKFGILYPSDYELAKEISRRDKTIILPTGMTAANMIGLSEQVPMKSVFLTNGTPRTIKTSQRTIIFKRSIPKTFMCQSQTMPLVIASLKAIGKNNITDTHKHVIKNILTKEAKNNIKLLYSDSYLAPIWIKKIIIQLLNAIEYESTISNTK